MDEQAQNLGTIVEVRAFRLNNGVLFEEEADAVKQENERIAQMVFEDVTAYYHQHHRIPDEIKQPKVELVRLTSKTKEPTLEDSFKAPPVDAFGDCVTDYFHCVSDDTTGRAAGSGERNDSKRPNEGVDEVSRNEEGNRAIERGDGVPPPRAFMPNGDESGVDVVGEERDERTEKEKVLNEWKLASFAAYRAMRHRSLDKDLLIHLADRLEDAMLAAKEVL